MEFHYKINEFISSNFIIINNEDVVSYYKISSEDRRRYYLQLEKTLDSLGELSAKEQLLKKSITTFTNLINTNHRVYLAVDHDAFNGRGAATGYVKVGQKKLFLTDGQREQVAVDMPCVLDFYVYSSEQRRGLGRQIFDYMLESEHLSPGEMAFDRPSDKLIRFLRKHYNLVHTIWQPNRYTVYKDYFERHPNSIDNYKKRNSSSGSLLNSDYQLAAAGSTSSHRRVDSFSKIIQQVPPSP